MADAIHPYYRDRQAEIRAELENGMAIGRSEFGRLVPGVPFDEMCRLATAELDAVLALVPYAGGSEGRMTPFFQQGAGVIALGRALRKLGVSAKDIGSLMRTVFLSKFYDLRREERFALGREWLSAENQDYLKREAVKSRKRENPGDFVYEFVEGGDSGPAGRPFAFGIDYLECGFCKVCRAGGDEDLLPHICAMDKESYGIRGVDFQRSTTLAAGDDRCNFRFSSLDIGATKGEVGVGQIIETKLRELGIELANPVAPVANYVPAVQSGRLIFIAGQIALGADNKIAPAHRGKLGGEVGDDDGRAAARVCALNMLAQLKAAIGDLDRVVRCVRLTGYVNARPDFASLPQIMNGASDLITDIFGEKGRHARVTVGVAQLPFDSAVEVEGIFELD